MKFFISALFLGLSIVATAQNRVVGTIVNSQNQSLSGVNISIPEIHIETTSDINGKYILNNLPNGNFKIIFKHIGFESQTKNFI